MILKVLITLIFVLLICAQSAAAQGWRGIVPLHSTRADVERLLGLPSGECKCFYEAGGEAVRVFYSKGPCEGDPSGWNVPADAVLRFTVEWNQRRKFSDLRLDESKYEKAYDHTLHTYYSSREEGVQYAVSHVGETRGVSYIPLAKDSRLRCPCFPPEDESVFRTPPFDEFSGMSLDVATARLDNFAIQLSQVPGWKGYVIVYAGRRTPPARARRYAQALRKHLVVRRGLPSDSVVMIDGGYRDDLSVESYLFRGDIPAPKARPTRVPCRARANNVKGRGGVGRT